MPAACAGHALTHVYLLVYPAVLLQVGNEFSASNAELGAVYTVGFFFGLMALPAGWLVSRVGAAYTISAGFAGAALASAAVGLTTSLAGLAGCLLLLHVALGVYHPAGNTLISHYSAARGRALGLHGTFGSAGEALGPVLGALLALAWWGWRGAFVALAIPGIVLAVWFARLGQRLSPQPVSHPADRHDGPFFNAPFVLVLVVLLLNGCLYRTVLLFLPKFMAQSGPDYTWLELGEQMGLKGGLFASLILALGGIGQWVSGHLSDRYNQPLLLAGVYGLAALALGGMAMLSGLGLLVVSLAFGLVYFMIQPVTNALVARYSTAPLRGWAFGLAFFAQFGPGAIAQQLGGWIGDHQGLHAIYGWGAGWALGIALTALVLLVVTERLRSV